MHTSTYICRHTSYIHKYIISRDYHFFTEKDHLLPSAKITCGNACGSPGQLPHCKPIHLCNKQRTVFGVDINPVHSNMAYQNYLLTFIICYISYLKIPTNECIKSTKDDQLIIYRWDNSCTKGFLKVMTVSSSAWRVGS